MENKHYLHPPHPLTLYEINDSQFLCPFCGDPSFDKSYSCNKCGFSPESCFYCQKRPSGRRFYFCKECGPGQSSLLHESCVNLPREIQIAYHPHSALRIEGYSMYENYKRNQGHDCDFCDQKFDRYTFRCQKCKFQIHFGCAVMLMEDPEIPKRIKHFSHRHPLTLLKVDDMDCSLCNKMIEGQSYGCASCEFFLHESCGELLQEIRHTFHSAHFLTLKVDKYSRYKCNVCRFPFQGLRYRCDKCDYNLDPGCIYSKANIKHKDHEHLLVLVENNVSYQRECEACGYEIQGAFFASCVECSLDFHVHCGSLSLPPTVEHKQHLHPLTLCNGTLVQDDSNVFYCKACKMQRNPKHPTYFCAECNYYAHVRCVITEIQVVQREGLRHFSHPHFLIPLKDKINDDIICCACEKDIKADISYCCDRCKFYLHKSCAELPREKQHPFHQHHLALPKPYLKNHRECNACHRPCYGFTYSCSKSCKFNLDLDCSLLHPSVKSEVHEHILTFFEKLYITPKCKICNNPDHTPYLRCVNCDFNVHLFCFPLPQTIKDDCHQHFLTLKDNFFRLFDYYKDDKYYCDVCETKRDAREYLYYCKECVFVVDIICVISEVIRCLEGKRGDVQLINIANREIIKRLEYRTMVLSFTEMEKQVINHALPNINQVFADFHQQVGDEVTARELKLAFNEESLRSKAKEYAQEILRYGSSPYFKAEVIKFRGYRTFPKFVPLLERLFHKYGDIGAGCYLTQRLKTVPTVAICATVQSMSNTKIMDIKINGSIFMWWYHLRFVQRAGFSIDFALGHLKKVAHDHFVSCTVVLSSGPLHELHEKKEKLSREVQKRTQKIDELREEIDERTAELEKLSKGAQEIVSNHISEQSRLEAERLNKALEICYKDAATGLL